MKDNFFPEASAIPESRGEIKAITKKENEIEYEYRTVFITFHPKKFTMSDPSIPLVTLL